MVPRNLGYISNLFWLLTSISIQGILYVEIEMFVYLKQEENKLIKVTFMVELIGSLL